MKGFPQRQFISLFYSIPIVMLLLSCSRTSSTEEPRQLIIATAANLQFVMDELVSEFEKDTGLSCKLVVSSSGKLSAQIEAGAPFDIFIAANMKYPQAIYNKGFALEPPKVYARGRLVLWTTKADLTPSLEVLTDNHVKNIALANPQTAPYGAAALQVMQQSSAFESLKHKFVFGESIAQTNQFIISKSSDLGFTSMSVVLSPEMKDKGRWIEIDPSLYSPIDQGMIIVKHEDKDLGNAKMLYDYLLSEKAQQTFERFGYLIE